MNTSNNATLSRDGVVLQGKELEKYSKMRGLCHLCAGVATHKRAGKFIKRNKWKPMTVVGEKGEYVVYKGYCLQPTCYTLDQAKEVLGEKPVNPRVSFSSRRDSASIVPLSSSLRSDPKYGSKADQEAQPLAKPDQDDATARSAQPSADDSSTLSFDVLQLMVSNHNNNNSESPMPRRLLATALDQRDRDAGGTPTTVPTTIVPTNNDENNPASESNGSPSHLFNASHKWSRELPYIRLPSLSDTSRHGRSGSCDQSLMSADLTVTIHSQDGHQQPQSQPQPQQQPQSQLPQTSKDTEGNDNDMIELDKTVKELLGLQPQQQSSKVLGDSSHGDDPTIDSSDSCSTTSTISAEGIFSSIPTISFDHPDNLPGSGFVSCTTEGNYRAALEALDLAPGATQESKSASFQIREYGALQLQALCLQSKHLDYGDIEVVAVEVDSENRQWLSPEFLLDEDEAMDMPVKCGNEKMIVIDPSGSRLVHLSHLYDAGGMEELEVETDLNQFARLDLYVAHESYNFKSRASLEAEINTCEAAITSAQVSDDPTVIEKGILSRSRLGNLLPLRRFFRSRKKLEKKVLKISQKLEALDDDDLDRRYELAIEKSRLSRQITEEMEDEELHMPKPISETVEPTDEAQSTEISDAAPQEGGILDKGVVEPYRSVQPLADKSAPHSDVVNALIELDAERSIRFDRNGSVVENPSIVEVHMTVFQSAPLAYVDRATGTHHVCPLLDFEYEARALTQSLKDAEITGAQMDVEFDIATTDRLSAFLAKSESRVMHLSCHGHPDYLALENGFGGMQILPVRDLKRFIAAGAGNLEVVFVSACHSKAAGKAFLKAGIRHVICCRQDDKFRDEGAIEFARSFYRALALKNTLKQAFNMAREAMRVSPMVRDSKAEYEKFILLPEKPADDPYHDVHIFKHPKARTDDMALGQELRKTRIIPRTPQFFIGREMDMYTILEALRSNDIIHVQGPPEIGKASLVAATTRYIEQRHKSFLFDETVWLPVHAGSVPSDDQLYLDLSRIFDLISKASEAPCQRESDYEECWRRTLQHLHDKRPLIVVHGSCLASKYSMKSLEDFLRHLLQVSNAKVITVGVPAINGLNSAVINVEALDFDATVLLFARLSRSASITAPKIISAFTTTLSSSADIDTCKGKVIAWRRERVFERFGAGVPTEIRKAALEMPDDELSELMRASQRPIIEVDSRSDLEKTIRDLELKESEQLEDADFLLARDTRETIEELLCLRKSFPTMQDLLFEEKELEDSLERAVSYKQYDNASHLRKRLDSVKEQIAKETAAAAAAEEREEIVVEPMSKDEEETVDNRRGAVQSSSQNHALLARWLATKTQSTDSAELTASKDKEEPVDNKSGIWA